jgi:hypothetical protein
MRRSHPGTPITRDKHGGLESEEGLRKELRMSLVLSL